MRIFLVLIAICITACDTRIALLRSTPEGSIVTESAKGALGETPTQATFSRGLFGDGDCPADDNEDDDICRASFYFSKQGYEAQRLETLVKGEYTIVHAYLKPIQTSLNLAVFPDFSLTKISVQNNDESWSNLVSASTAANTLSLNDDTLWQGKDKDKDKITLMIHAEALGYIPENQRLTIQKGEHKQHEITLEEYAIVGQIKSTPSGADVYERSLGYLGRTPFKLRVPYDQLVRISPERRQNISDPVFLFLEIKKPGYQTVNEIAAAGKIDKAKKPDLFTFSITLSPIH